ncbi:putative aminopeptidase W07G4.4 [Xenia sp. Carnegie-2017]|uniref:putative aminopeptidase W07G4.4 n=1 Tax=Xenia sp. Carnegie-2017 TaxID=2897299 RepID=UPI001F04E87C|nr:putative aminopeptidase W07G4.4 [Xenia sp. Carnegie-2017]
MEIGLDGRIFPITLTNDPNNADYDCIVLVSENLDFTDPELEYLKAPLNSRKEVDSTFEKEVSFIEAPGNVQRLVYVPTGPVNRDYDDVRRYYDAACNGMKRALKAGSKRPVLALPATTSFIHSWTVSAFGALHALYTPIEVAVFDSSKAMKIDALALFYSGSESEGEKLLEYVKAVETGRMVCRDIAASDPEFSCTSEVEKYVLKVLGNEETVQITVTKGTEILKQQYPLLAAVDRAATVTERHQGRVINLEYNPLQRMAISDTVMLVGKGVAYDTGGADIKTGGNMPGMNRDKSGAAAVAGFFKTLSMLKPAGIRVRGTMAMVRNSVGPEMYVADEIITAASGVRIRVNNTDAEGRFAMGDCLFYMKQEAIGLPNPQIYTFATLTGHCIRTYGPNYSAIMQNGPAKEKNLCQAFQAAGDSTGEPCEISTMRREDFDASVSNTEYEDFYQLDVKSSNRGHQFAGVFLQRASGLDKHGSDSQQKLPYVHFDIAGSSGIYPEMPTATPILGLSAFYLRDRVI